MYGYSISPILFKICIDGLIQEWKKEAPHRTNLMFTNDTVPFYLQMIRLLFMIGKLK